MSDLAALRAASLTAVAGDIHGAGYTAHLHKADAAYIAALEAEVRRLQQVMEAARVELKHDRPALARRLLEEGSANPGASANFAEGRDE